MFKNFHNSLNSLEYQYSVHSSLKAQPADFSSVRCFKRFLDKTNFSKFLHFC